MCEGLPFPVKFASLECLNWINDLFFCVSRDALARLMALFYISVSLHSVH